MTSELETNIVAVERVKEYSETPTEVSAFSEPHVQLVYNVLIDKIPQINNVLYTLILWLYLLCCECGCDFRLHGRLRTRNLLIHGLRLGLCSFTSTVRATGRGSTLCSEISAATSLVGRRSAAIIYSSLLLIMCPQCSMKRVLVVCK